MDSIFSYVHSTPGSFFDTGVFSWENKVLMRRHAPLLAHRPQRIQVSARYVLSRYILSQNENKDPLHDTSSAVL
jgi:hypothetical protein